MKNIKSENKFVDRSNAHGLFNFDKDGTLRIAGVTAYMVPMASFAIQNHLMRNYLDKKKLENIIYYTGKIQGIVSVKLLRDKFGIKSVKEIFFTTLDQLRMIGFGRNEVIRFNEKGKHAILKKEIAPFEDIYAKIFGHQKEPIEHFHRGALAGMLGELFGEDVVVIERQCKARGSSFCINEGFTLKSVGDRSLNASEKSQIPTPESDFPELKELKSVLPYLK